MFARTLAIVAISSMAAGCASSKVTAFRDPAYANAQFSKLLVFGRGMDIEAATAVERELCKKLAPTPCTAGITVLPPTRPYTNDEVIARIAQSGADAVLVLSLLADNADSRYIGTYTNSETTGSSASSGSVNLYGNTAYWSGATTASSSTTSVSTPMYSYSREVRGALTLFESASGNVAWSGQIRTSGQGMFTVTDDEFIRSMTSRIAKDIRTARLVR